MLKSNRYVSLPKGGVGIKKQSPPEGLRSLRAYLGFISIKGRELSRLAVNIRRLERLVLSGRRAQAERYGDLLARSHLLLKASAHSVL